MNRSSIAWRLLLGLVMLGTSGSAHEGEQHGPPAGASPTGPARHTMTATSKNYEIVVKNAPLEIGEEARIDLYVSDFETNSPVSGASVRLSLRARAGGREIWGGTAAPSELGGVYAATVTPSDTGAVNVIVAVQADGRQDEFALAGLEIGTQAHPVATPAALPGGLALWIGLGGLLAAGVLTALWRARRRAVRAASALVVGGWTALAPMVADGHEGHDQPPAVSGGALEPRGEVYLAKESQFLLGVLTKPVVLENVQNHLQVQGRVAPRSGGELEIVAPQAGRIYFPRGRTPILGERIRRGQLVATLLVVDSLNLRSALGGVVTEVDVVNGQLVDAGQKILRVLDSSVLWVHADIYERDLASVERAHVARIVSPAYPDQVFEGRRVALGASLGEVQGTVEAYFEVANPAGRLRVGALVDIQIEQGGSRPALIVPRSAFVEKDGRTLVFVHTSPERFAAREVRQVVNLGDRIGVQGDLAPGERVVVSGSYQLLSAPVVSIGS